ncbi:MAG: response regulator [Bacteroidetes bacterium]|jgi:two-component system LytT family response regulator|nr:response regulator [Bacteroidota bacterium]
MIRAIIIDNEKKGVELVNDLLGLCCPSVSIVATASSVQSGFDAIQQHRPELVFLDIRMQDGTGFDLLNRFPSLDFRVIFVTAYDEYAMKAFQFSAVDYILKPMSSERLIAAVQKAEQSLTAEALLKINTLLSNVNTSSKETKKIVLKTAERIYVVPVKDIVRCESDGSYTHVFLQDSSKILVSRLLKEFEEMLGGYGFFRPQQSHLINLEYLHYYEKGDSLIAMRDKTSIPVASRKKEELLKLIRDI